MDPEIEEQNIATAHERMAMLASKKQKSRKRGFTILASLFVAVIAGLYVGLQYYKKSADRAACIVSQSAIKKTIYSTAGINSYGDDRPLSWDDIEGPTKAFTLRPRCPSGGKYSLPSTWGEVYGNSDYPFHIQCSCEGH